MEKFVAKWKRRKEKKQIEKATEKERKSGKYKMQKKYSSARV